MPILREAQQPFGSDDSNSDKYPLLADISGLNVTITPRSNEKAVVNALITLSIGMAYCTADAPVIFVITVDDVIVGEAFSHVGANRGFNLTLQKVVDLAVDRQYTIKGKFAPRDAGSTVHVLSDDTVSQSKIVRNLINVLLLD